MIHLDASSKSDKSEDEDEENCYFYLFHNDDFYKDLWLFAGFFSFRSIDDDFFSFGLDFDYACYSLYYYITRDLLISPFFYLYYILFFNCLY